MNAVEIVEAVTKLVAEPFNRAEFPYEFLTAFGNKETTLKRLRSGQSNASDVAEGVLQRNNIHIAVRRRPSRRRSGRYSEAKTLSAKAKFILATDGVTVEAEDLQSGEPLATPYAELGDHFGFFLP